MKTVRRVFGVLLAMIGAVMSVIIALAFAETLHDWRGYDIDIDIIWRFLLMHLVDISVILLGIYLIRKTPVKKERKAKMTSDNVQTEEFKTFRSEPKEQFKVFCFIVLVSVALTAFLFAVSNLNSIKPVLSVLLPFTILLALLISCIAYRIRVEIGDFGIRFYRGAHMYASYPLDSGFHIAQDAEDMQRIYPLHAISIGHVDQKKKRQVFFGFSNREFSAAWATLSALLNEPQTMNPECQSVPMPQSFAIPKAKIKTAMRRKILQTFSVVLVLGESLVVLLTGLIILPNKEVFGTQSVYIGMAAALLLAVISAAISASGNMRLSDLVPEKIAFGESWLSVGDHLYYASQMKQINYTAADYRPLNIGKPFCRYLIIHTSSDTGTYLLGHQATVQYQVYQDYALLISALCDWCENHAIPASTIPDPCVGIKAILQNCEDS